MDFEDRIKRIKEILDSLNNADLSLKDGMELYKEGIKEISEAQKMLEEAKILYNEIKDSTKETNIKSVDKSHQEGN
ncbi:exodeoxyribonuclease VII small subunit [Helicobacter sp. 16-1353]|uniref:exodeoxyribonuclease VII small subunit n=1 Tax=Helicobacter sp. 16-1353 TaxID=2004996 RepID=UPI000DCEC330|nr:exodeoxyribonuclease VII small subunit [Helicobacter sp. 16-1353]RAX55190.1 exodeoxyribonuclease VII small subunit [Helicobacter sp. 16-1353]